MIAQYKVTGLVDLSAEKPKEIYTDHGQYIDYQKDQKDQKDDKHRYKRSAKQVIIQLPSFPLI